MEGVAKKNLRRSMPERGKEANAGDVAKKIWGGGGMLPNRGKDHKMRGGVAKKNEGGGISERGKEDKMWGGVKNYGGGGWSHTIIKGGGGGSVDNYVFFKGSNIKWNTPFLWHVKLCNIGSFLCILYNFLFVLYNFHVYCIISHLYCIISYLYCIFSYFYCIIFICIV